MVSRNSTVPFLFSASVILLSLAIIAQWAAEYFNIADIIKKPLQHRSDLITDEYVCSHNYSIEILSFDPWVVYINNFIKEEEIQHLLAMPNDWRDSPVRYQTNEGDAESNTGVQKEFRSSKSTSISGKDKVALCLSKRIKSLLGSAQHEELDPIELVRYEGGERFRLHQDWSNPYKSKTSNNGNEIRYYNRLISAFAYLEDNCIGGETYFPEVQSVGLDADGDKFSRTESGDGLVVRPRRGNAVLWKNLHSNGTGDSRVLHASLPVRSGRKIGMNLFSRYFEDSPMLGG